MVLAEDIAMDERYLEPRAGDEGWGARSWRLMKSWFFEFFYMWIRFRLIVPEMSRNANFFSTVEPNGPSIECSFNSSDPDRSKSNCFLPIIYYFALYAMGGTAKAYPRPRTIVVAMRKGHCWYLSLCGRGLVVLVAGRYGSGVIERGSLGLPHHRPWRKVGLMRR